MSVTASNVAFVSNSVNQSAHTTSVTMSGSFQVSPFLQGTYVAADIEYGVGGAFTNSIGSQIPK